MNVAVREHVPLAVRRDYERWYDLIEHPVQTALVEDDVRFKVVPAGRRSGKTERAKRFVVKKAFADIGPYFVAAPTRGQVKKIYWNDLKRLALTSLYGQRSVSESELEIRLPNGSTITLIGLDQPQRIEGSFWKGGIIDEIADVKIWGNGPTSMSLYWNIVTIYTISPSLGSFGIYVILGPLRICMRAEEVVSVKVWEV